MKIRFYLAMAAAALLMTNCSQDEPLVQEKGSTNTLTATIEGASRSSVTDGGVFSWNEGDAIAVGNKNRTFTTFVSNADGVFSATESIIPTDYAIYPSNIAPQTLPESGNLPTVTLPATYEYGSTHAPMLATIGQNATSLQFKHLAGLMRFKVKNVPAGADSFVLTTKQQTITGDFTPVQNGTEVQINQTGDATQSVTIKFARLDAQKDEMTFYIPMPVGEYENLHVKIAGSNLNTNNDDDYGLMSGTGVKNTITRGKLLLMPTMVCDNTGDITLEDGANEGSSIELVDDSEVDLAVASGDNVVVEMTDGTEATLNLIADASGAELTISDGSDSGTASQDSQATLNISSDASILNINTPTLTVKLTEGSYDKVEALTAQQTLIIGKGVTIKELILKGGELEVEEGANLFVKTSDTTYEIYGAGGLKAFRDAVNTGTTFAGCTIDLMCDIDLNNEEWEPIGIISQPNGFCGDFNGNNKTIKNLQITNATLDSDGYAYVGLFGITEENTIKDLVIENVNISTEGHIVAAAIAYPYYTTVENITVKGNINIKGGNYTAGVLAYTRRCYDAKGLIVEGNENSSIEGNSTVGGVISDIQTQDGKPGSYCNFTVTGLTIKGTQIVGGISGIISHQKLDGATVKNVSIDDEVDDNRIGIVSGADGGNSTIENVSYENVTGATRIIGGTYKGGYYFGQILELEGVKAIVYATEGGVKAVSVEELNLKGKNLSDATTWATELGEGWALASIEELDAIHTVRADLNDVLAADNADNALFCETEYYADGKYAMYISSTEATGTDPQGEAYYANRVHLKYFNLNGYWDYPLSTFATINKSAPLKDNHFARAVYTF